MRERRRNLMMIAAAVVIGLLVGAGLVFLMAKANVLKGDRGDLGIAGHTPVKGVDYFDGIDGLDGKDGLNGVNGTNGRDGRNGRDGSPGKDVPLNRVPTITLMDLNMTTVTKYCRVNYSVVVTILDPDGDNFQATFFVDAGDGFVPVKQAFGSDGDFVASVMLKPPKSMSWLVEVWDGQDIALAVFDYLIL